MLSLAILSLFIGKYPLSLRELMAGNDLQWKVFLTLRLSRTIVGIFGGFGLSVAGFVYQTVFRNPLASPDLIGVSSGASAGAAAGILFFAGTHLFGGFTAVTLFSFAGAILAVLLSLALASIDRSAKNGTIILAGIAVHAIAQTVLMYLKLAADPEKELASIEYWIMGSLNGVNSHAILENMILSIICIVFLFLLHRQILLLSAEEGEAKMLGADVGKLRLGILILATLIVSAIVSLTGLISFVALLAPHAARMLMKNNRSMTMLLSGIIGSSLLLLADILARSAAETELPVSIFTSMLGAPFLIYLIVKVRKEG